MWAIEFFVYALIVFLLALMLGGGLIGYYFAKKAEYEATKARNFGELLKGFKGQKEQ